MIDFPLCRLRAPAIAPRANCGEPTAATARLLCLLAALAFPLGARAQERPVPDPIEESPGFVRAVEAETRTRSGRPGPAYWQQDARYEIAARLDPATGLLSGRVRIRYVNLSPDTLRRVMLHLRQNLFAKGAVRLEPTPVTGGMELHGVRVGGEALMEIAADSLVGYRVEGTLAWVRPGRPLPPGDTLALRIAWSYEPAPVPSDGREGREGDVFFLGYWYPQLAVYDDVEGWAARRYTGRAEFYMGRADYEVSLTVPAGWAVGATGTLRNPEEVLADRTIRRLDTLRREGGVARLIGPGEAGTGAATRADGTTATWRFRAEDVRDFAWGTSDRYRWDVARALVPAERAARSTGRSLDARSPPDGPPPDTVLVHAFYRSTEEAAAWAEGGARYLRDAVEALSLYLRPYPYPQMTAMEGVLQSGGMEYPMVTVMQPWADTLKLAGDLMHEVGHMWVPMEVGTDEKRFVWMDEALTQYNTAQGMRMVYGSEPRDGRPNDSETGQRRRYLAAERSGPTVPLVREGDYMPDPLYGPIYYDKGAQVLAALRALLGAETFLKAYRAFFDRWWGRHPRPEDFFHAFADVTGRDLDWFWRSWFYESWTLDQAIAGVRVGADSTRVLVEDRGRVPMPVPLEIVRADGSRERRLLPVDAWLEGAVRRELTVATDPQVVRVEIDPRERYPDVDRSNQVWERRP